jgi:hypothetical protein
LGGGKIQGEYLRKCPLSELRDMRAPSGTFLARKIGEILTGEKEKREEQNKFELLFPSQSYEQLQEPQDLAMLPVTRYPDPLAVLTKST